MNSHYIYKYGSSFYEEVDPQARSFHDEINSKYVHKWQPHKSDHQVQERIESPSLWSISSGQCLNAII